MKSLVSAIAVACVAGSFACGGSQSASDTTAEPSAGDCSYGESDPCVTSDALAQCRAMAARCPGRILALESCPLQFACPGEAGADGDTSASSPAPSAAEDPNASVGNEPEPCEGYRLGESCINETNFAQCQQMAARCPGQVQVAESCPLQFSCP
jgi:hypothetical protein